LNESDVTALSQSARPHSFKLAAIDLDGTLLGPDQRVSAENARAVRRLQDAGAQVVLASGRHHKAMQPFAVELPGVEWIVSCQGAELASVDRAKLLHRTFFHPHQSPETLALGKTLGFTTIAYTAEGVFTDCDWDAEMEHYSRLSGHRPLRLSTAELSNYDWGKVIWMGQPEQITRITTPTPPLPPPVQIVRTHARFLEFFPAHVTKASALEVLAARLSIAASDAVAFGDGENDIPMFDWAGFSVAMPHGWPAAISRAKMVAPPGPDETAFARAVDFLLERNAGG
jgi:Cof subfamily protein (haloacid dehalogenase superfamily)